MADNKAKPSKEKVDTAPKKASSSGKNPVPSQKEKEDMKVLELLREMKAKMDKSEEMLNRVTKRVENLENIEKYDDYGHFGQHHYEYGDIYEEDCYNEANFSASTSGVKRLCEENKDDKNNEAVVDSRFSSLAKRFKGQEVTDKDLDSVLSSNITDLFRKGMEEEQYNELLKDDKLSRPPNCEGLSVVKCNQLVWDLISPNAHTTDKKLQNIEISVVKSATILAKMVDKTAKIEKQIKEKESDDISYIIDHSNDAIALLGHANRQINLLRKDLLRPEHKNEYSHLCNHTVPYTCQLFGDDVSKAAKEIEDAAEIGNKMQYGQYRGGFRGSRGGFHGRLRVRPWSRGFGRGRSFYGAHSSQSGGDPKNMPRRGSLRFPAKN